MGTIVGKLGLLWFWLLPFHIPLTRSGRFPNLLPADINAAPADKAPLTTSRRPVPITTLELPGCRGKRLEKAARCSNQEIA